MSPALDATERLLARLSRVRPEPEVAASDLAGVDLERLAILAARLANFRLVASRLIAPGLPVPGGIRDRVARNLAWAELKERLGLADVAGLATDLGRSGEPLLLLKGAAFTRFIYPRPAIRSFTDLDVLVRKEALPEAVLALGRLGYEKSHEIEGSIDFVRPVGESGVRLGIELHTSLVHHHEYPYYREELALDERRLLSRAEERLLDGVPVLVLRASDELLYSILHFFFHHDLRGLKYHSDLNALLTDERRALDFEEAIAVATEARGEVAVGLALLVHTHLFGADSVPAGLLERLAPRGLRRWAKVLVAPGLAGPVGLALRRLFPGKRYLMWHYGLAPEGWSRGYHLRYPAFVLGNGLRRTFSRSRAA
jgi:hypothetical protein